MLEDPFTLLVSIFLEVTSILTFSNIDSCCLFFHINEIDAILSLPAFWYLYVCELYQYVTWVLFITA